MTNFFGLLSDSLANKIMTYNMAGLVILALALLSFMAVKSIQSAWRSEECGQEQENK